MRHDELGPLLMRRLGESPHLASEAKRFVGVKNDDTVQRWLKTGKYPRGENLNKLWYFLAAAGIESPELDDLVKEYPLGAYLGKLMAFGVITFQDAQSWLDMDRDDTLRIIRGEQMPSGATESVKSLQDAFAKDLKNAEEELQKRLARVTSPPSNPVSQKPVQSTPVMSSFQPSPDRAEQGEDNRVFIMKVASRIGELHAMIQYALDTFTDEEVAKIREYANNYVVFGLSNALNAMGSSRSRNADRK